MKISLLFFCSTFLMSVLVYSQNYTSYFTGNQEDVRVETQGGICLMGGSTENDNAMRWFLNKANGGDILVLRASGSNGYNNYFYSELGVNVNSVESIVFHNIQAANDSYIIDKINQAEAIWLAGGDQWNYVNYWKNTGIADLINQALTDRNIVIGGTSAGMAVLGSHYFSGENGSVTTDEAFQNPYNQYMTLGGNDFLHVPFLENVITDTHYDERSRQGRHMVFLGRLLEDFGENINGIACDERTVICIDRDGLAHVYGNYPASDDNAFFIQVNCEIENNFPENMRPNQWFTWSYNNQALKVYNIKGTQDGTNYFDLNTWQNGSGGNWFNWAANTGNFGQFVDDAPMCETMNVVDLNRVNFKIYPNPTTDYVYVQIPENDFGSVEFRLYNSLGQLMPLNIEYLSQNQVKLDLKQNLAGTFILQILSNKETKANFKIIKK